MEEEKQLCITVRWRIQGGARDERPPFGPIHAVLREKFPQE